MGERLLASGVASRWLRLGDLALHLHGLLQCVDHLRQRARSAFAILRGQTLLLFELAEFAVDRPVDALDERAWLRLRRRIWRSGALDRRGIFDRRRRSRLPP